jgi:predicted metalloprotease with PDZ domain
MPLTIQHHVSIADPRTHLVEVETVVRSDAPLPGPLVVFMPVWTPGSYLVREYARHVESVRGFSDGAPFAPVKVRKNAWRLGRAGATQVSIRYEVYANELTVRTNHVDESHGFLNGAALFVAVEGHESAPSTVDLAVPPGWHVLTSLPSVELPEPRGLEARGKVRLFAKDFDTLVDAPIELGHFRIEHFEAKGVAHEVAIWPKGRVDDGQVAKLLRDFGKIIDTQAAWFGGALPYDRYAVLLHLSSRARGGLEHMSSAALIANPNAFASREAYLDLLSLFAHELFHAWNIKRIRPEGLVPYRYEQENYTRLLWWFEGATNYYGWRTLVVSGLSTPLEYKHHLESEIAALEEVPGRLVQSLEQASFDAWIKLYRPDENSENSSISYYRKGEVVSALLDLEIRARTSGRSSLDQLLGYLWDRYGKVGRAVPEDGMLGVFEEGTGAKLADLFDAWIRSPGEIDYDATLARAGLRLARESGIEAAAGGADGEETKPPRASLGLRVRSDGVRAFVTSVVRGRAAQLAGIDPGDELVAIGGRRVEGGSVEGALTGRVPGEEIEVTAARDGRLVTVKLRTEEARSQKVRLVPRDGATAAEESLGRAWLGVPDTAAGPGRP